MAHGGAGPLADTAACTATGSSGGAAQRWALPAVGGAAGLVASATTPPRCLRAQPLGDSACFNVWGRRLAGSGTYALALVNNDAVAATVRCDRAALRG